MPLQTLRKYAPFILALLAALLLSDVACAAGTTGTALQGAFTTLDDMANGYGKQLLVLVAFVGAAFALMAANAGGAIMKFIGVVIFLASALPAAITLSGATI